MTASLEDRVGALHRWWRYHVAPIDLDPIWTARWTAFIDAGFTGPDLSSAAMQMRGVLERDLPAGSLPDYGIAGGMAEILHEDTIWDPAGPTITPYFREVIACARSTGARLAAMPSPRSNRPPKPARKPREAAAEPAVQSTVAPTPAPVQFIFGDMRKEFGL